MIEIEPDLDIVVVDDSDGDRLITGIVLKRCGLTNPVVLLDSAEQALAHLTQAVDNGRRPPALVLLDVNMHGMTGFDVLTFIREHDAFGELPVVAMLTSSDAASDEERASTLGANAYLVKKSGVGAFVEMIDGTFRNRS
ncbi:MAG: response regulator [Nannocystales bacterium]